MQHGERARLEAELLAEDLHERAVHLSGVLHEGAYGALHARVHRRRVRAVDGLRPRKRVVLGDVDELDRVERASLIDSVRASGFVSGEADVRASGVFMCETLPEGHAVVALFELHLLFERQAHCLLAHVEHGVDQLIGAMVLHTKNRR